MQEYDYNERLAFFAEWFDYDSALYKKFILNYYPSDNTIELYDCDANRMFLKRLKCENQFDDFFVGNTLRVYGRQITITDYADSRTAGRIGKQYEHTLAIIKPTIAMQLGEILNRIESENFRPQRMRMCRLQRDEATELYASLKGDAFLPFVLDAVTAGPLVAVELVGVDAVARWQRLLGPSDPLEARRTVPNSLRAIYGIEAATNGFHGAENAETVVRETEFFFGQKAPPSIATVSGNVTCCIIKPHAIREGKLGYMLTAIQETGKFRVSALETRILSDTAAHELLEVYEGVVADFHAFKMSFIGGPCVALEIAAAEGATDINVHTEFRRFVGPQDSDVARQIRPESMRARFGVDKYKNAVHCTDLAEDTVLELEYLFKILEH